MLKTLRNLVVKAVLFSGLLVAAYAQVDVEGTFTLSKTIVKPVTPITATFADWSDEALPLSYQVLIDGVPVGPPSGTPSRVFSAAVADGQHTITGRITNALGNFTDVDRVITVDGTPPVITVPEDIVLKALSPPGVQVVLPPGSITIVDAIDPAPFVSGAELTYFVFTDSSRNAVVTAIDAAGNMKQESYRVTVLRGYVQTRVSAQAGKVNGSLIGTALEDAPDLQLFTIGVPSITTFNHMVMTGSARSTAGTKVAGILVGRSDYNGHPEVRAYETQWTMPLRAGAPAEEVGAGLMWKAFPREPFLCYGDDAIPRPPIGIYTAPARAPVEFGFLGRVSGPGVTAANDDVLAYFSEQPLMPTQTVVLAREGGDAPGVEGGKFKSFQAAAMATRPRIPSSSSTAPPPGKASMAGIAFTAMLETGPRGTPGPGGVNQASDMALYITEDASEGAPVALVLREGQQIAGRTVRSFVALRGPVGHGQSFTRDDSGYHYLGTDGDGHFTATVLVTFTDGVKWLAHASVGGLSGIAATTGFHEFGYSGPGAEWTGFPAWGRDCDGRLVALATMRGVSRTVNATIVGEVGGDPRRLVSKGMALADGSVLTALGAPVLNRDTTLAFTGKTNASSATRLFTHDVDGDIRQFFETAAQAPGTDGAVWRKLEAHAMPNEIGPLFTAKLRAGSTAEPAPAGVTAATDTGLWAVDTFGVTHLLIREGQSIAGKTVRAFKALTSVAGSPGQARSFNGKRGVVVWVLAADRTQHLVHFDVPQGGYR
jgi:hypothetical protein